MSVVVEQKENGPVLVYTEDGSEMEVKKADGTSEKRKSIAICNCGKSKNLPFCDGSHAETNK